MFRQVCAGTSGTLVFSVQPVLPFDNLQYSQFVAVMTTEQPHWKDSPRYLPTEVFRHHSWLYCLELLLSAPAWRLESLFTRITWWCCNSAASTCAPKPSENILEHGPKSRHIFFLVIKVVQRYRHVLTDQLRVGSCCFRLAPMSSGISHDRNAVPLIINS